MSEFAVIKTGGKQYLVAPGKKIRVEKLPRKNDEKSVIFDEVLLAGKDDKISFGNPIIKGASVKAEISKEGKAKKVVIARYHSKNRYRKLKGHRQPFTEVVIKEIVKK